MKRLVVVSAAPVLILFSMLMLSLVVFAEESVSVSETTNSSVTSSILVVTNTNVTEPPFGLTVGDTNLQMQNDRMFIFNDTTNFLQNNHIVAYYGHPNSRKMGILGWYPLDILAQKLEVTVNSYDETNGSNNTIPAFYIIYGTCQPAGEIGILNRATTEKYIEFARQRGYLVFLDHQIGKYTVEQAMNRLLPFLKYPNVHLAIDPEWRTLIPMKEIGSITAEELNGAQAQMKDYMIRNKIPGKRMLVVHQFNHVMIKRRQLVKADYDPVILIHTQDGFGSPQLKKGTYSYNALAKNMPVKGFKLFYKSGYKGAGFDEPLMKPAEVLNLKPQPFLIMYQ